MTIFDDAVMGPTRVDVEVPEIEDGQYVDGERVGGVNFLRDPEGNPILIRDGRVFASTNLSGYEQISAPYIPQQPSEFPVASTSLQEET